MIAQAAPPNDALASALAEEVRALGRTIKRRLREQGTLGDLTPSQVGVLVRLESDGPATVSMLARVEGMRPQSMGAIVGALEAAGLIEGASDPKDGRQTILSLTAACREEITAKRGARQDWLTRTIRAELTPAEQQQMAIGLTLLKRIIDA